MEIKDRKKKYQLQIQEIDIGKRKIRETGECYVVTIPKRIMEEYKLRKGMKVNIILLRLLKKNFGELKEGEEWIKMKKKDRIMFSQWMKEQEEESKWN